MNLSGIKPKQNFWRLGGDKTKLMAFWRRVICRKELMWDPLHFALRIG